MRLYCTIIIVLLSLSYSYSQNKGSYREIKAIKSDTICVISLTGLRRDFPFVKIDNCYFFLSNKFNQYKSFGRIVRKSNIEAFYFKYNYDNYLFIGEKLKKSPTSEWKIRYYPAYDIFNTGLGENYSDSISRVLISDFFSTENIIPDYSPDDYYLEEIIAQVLRHNNNHYALQMYNENTRFIFLNYTKKQEFFIKNNFYLPYTLKDSNDSTNADTLHHRKVQSFILEHINLLFPTITYFDVNKNKSGINYKQIAEQLPDAFKPLDLNNGEIEYDVVYGQYDFSQDAIQSADKQINIEISSINSNVYVAHIWLTINFQFMRDEYEKDLPPTSILDNYSGYILKIKCNSQNQYEIEFLRTTIFPNWKWL